MILRARSMMHAFLGIGVEIAYALAMLAAAYLICLAAVLI